jgi:hypothetical protein
LPAWYDNDEITSTMMHLTKMYITKSYEKYLAKTQLLASCIIDILHTIINKMYNINLKYIPANKTCIIDATYTLKRPQVRSSL